MTEHNTQTAARPDVLRPAIPAAVRNAAWVMYAGAVASVVRGVIYLVTTRATKAALEHRFPRLSAAHITTLTHATVIAGSVAGVIGMAAFVWIALECLHGKNWARITATVFCALGILGAFVGLVGGRSPASLIMGFVVAGIGLLSVCLLWQRSSSAYFENTKHQAS
jgi:hypothetical protein